MNIPQMLSRVKRKLLWRRIILGQLFNLVLSLFDLLLFEQTKQRQVASKNPLNAFGKKCFSQSDEDGITLEVLRRIGCLSGGVYAEFGVGNGTENNSLILAALGWKGFWVGGEDIIPQIKPSPHQRLFYQREWVNLDNIVALMKKGLQQVSSETVDVISLDLDGNDFYFAEALLSAKFRPKLFIIEYNAKFPPPVEFTIAYNPDHVWQNDDYMGASLTSLEKLFARFDYRLVCCNAHSGSNAFFVDQCYSDKFCDVPTDINEIYQEMRHWFFQYYGHPSSIRTIEQIINDPPSALNTHRSQAVTD